jgi:hypothetical protein
MNSPVWSGQLVVIDWPFTDRSSSKRRSALFVQEPDGHGDQRVLKVTSRKASESAMAVTPNDLAEGQPKTTSYLRLWHSLMIHELLNKDESGMPITVIFWPTLGKEDSTHQQERDFHFVSNQR